MTEKFMIWKIKNNEKPDINIYINLENDYRKYLL